MAFANGLPLRAAALKLIKLLAEADLKMLHQTVNRNRKYTHGYIHFLKAVSFEPPVETCVCPLHYMKTVGLSPLQLHSSRPPLALSVAFVIR